MPPIIKNLLLSKKFVVALLTASGAVAAYEGWNIDPTSIIAFITPFLVYIGAQGWADSGKERALIEQQTALKMHAMTLQRSNDLSAVMKSDAAMKSQAGSTSLLALMSIVLGMIGIALVLSASCLSSAQEKAGGGAAAACAASDIAKYAGQVEDALKQGDFSGALDKLKADNNLTQDALNCIIQTVVSVFAAGHPMTGQPEPMVINGNAYLASHGAKQ